MLAYAPVEIGGRDNLLGDRYLTDTPCDQQQHGDEQDYLTVFAFHDKRGNIGLTVSEVEQIDIGDEGEHETGMVDNPLLDRNQHDDERQYDEAEEQVDVYAYAGVFHNVYPLNEKSACASDTYLLSYPKIAYSHESGNSSGLPLGITFWPFINTYLFY